MKIYLFIITLLFAGCNTYKGLEPVIKYVECNGVSAEITTEPIQAIIPWELMGYKGYSVSIINLSDKRKRVSVLNGWFTQHKYYEWKDIHLYPKERCSIFQVKLKYGKFRFEILDKDYGHLGRAFIDMNSEL